MQALLKFYKATHSVTKVPADHGCCCITLIRAQTSVQIHVQSPACILLNSHVAQAL